MNPHCDSHVIFATCVSKTAIRFNISTPICRPKARRKLHVSQTHDFSQQNGHNPAFFLCRAFLMVQAASMELDAQGLPLGGFSWHDCVSITARWLTLLISLVRLLRIWALNNDADKDGMPVSAPASVFVLKNSVNIFCCLTSLSSFTPFIIDGAFVSALSSGDTTSDCALCSAQRAECWMLNGVGTLFSWSLIKGLMMRVIVQVRFDRKWPQSIICSAFDSPTNTFDPPCWTMSRVSREMMQRWAPCVQHLDVLYTLQGGNIVIDYINHEEIDSE